MTEEKKAKENEQVVAESESVEISRRERILRERLLTVEEDEVHAERRVKRNAERRKSSLTKQINRARRHQEEELDRKAKSKLYNNKFLRPLYYLTMPFRAAGRFVYGKLTGRMKHHQATTPHRSFYLTTHARAVRQINISGYGRFCREVWRMIKDNWWLYLKALLLLSIGFFLVAGIDSQSNYAATRDAMHTAGEGGFKVITTLMARAVTSGTTVTNTAKEYPAYIIILLGWLVLVYIARHVYGTNRPMKLRDALYQAGAPIISVLMIVLLIMIQLLPLALVMLAYTALSGASYISDGIQIENMGAWCIIALVAVLTLYWMITSLMCLVTVTIPGIYPLRAYYETSIQMSGRRVKVLLRLLMMLVPVVIVWVIALIPTVLIDDHFKFANFPLVGIVGSVLVAATYIWLTAYIYMFYRRIIDSPLQPEGTPDFLWPWQRVKRKKAINKKGVKQDGHNESKSVSAGDTKQSK